MDVNEERVQKHVVVSSPGQRSEVLTERTERSPREPGSSNGTIALVAVIALIAVAAIVYVVISRNANEAANRNANLAAAGQINSSQPPSTTIIQQPAQQAPVMIQQPAPAQQAPVIIQQPAEASQRTNTSANDDANMQDIATRRLAQEQDMSGVIMARAILTGTVRAEATRAKAEQLVKGVKGVKSVDNKIVITG